MIRFATAIFAIQSGVRAKLSGNAMGVRALPALEKYADVLR
jgi:hypothetical protein